MGFFLKFPNVRLPMAGSSGEMSSHGDLGVPGVSMALDGFSIQGVSAAFPP